MNCIEFRRILLVGGAESNAMRMHRLECASCAGFRVEHHALELELHTALEVEVPTGLAQRVLDSVFAAENPAQASRHNRRRFLALAAGVVAATGLGITYWTSRDDPLALACIQFVMKDEAKSIMMGAMPRSEAARLIAATLAIERIDAIGQIKHIGPCPFNGGTAYHVVLAVPQDKVTLLIMPDAKLSARGAALHEGMYGAVVPMGQGSVGIVGESKAVVTSIAGALRRPV